MKVNNPLIIQPYKIVNVKVLTKYWPSDGNNSFWPLWFQKVKGNLLLKLPLPQISNLRHNWSNFSANYLTKSLHIIYIFIPCRKFKNPHLLNFTRLKFLSVEDTFLLKGIWHFKSPKIFKISISYRSPTHKARKFLQPLLLSYKPWNNIRTNRSPTHGGS